MTTYIDRKNAKQSCLDLCLTSPALSVLTTISPLDDVGSDHMLMEITVETQPTKHQWLNLPRFNVSETKLKEFNKHHISSTMYQPTDMDSLAADLTNRLTQSATESFGPSSAAVKQRRKTPWWTEECKTAVSDRRKALKIMKSHPTIGNIINYKRLHAIARHTVKTSKQKSMEDYVSSLTHDTPIGKVWNKVKAFKTSYSPQTYPLEINGVPILNPTDKAEYMNNLLTGHQESKTLDENMDQTIIK